MFLTGTGANHNLMEAFNFFELGANAGNADAINNLGRMYERGWGTPANWKKAAELYADAARKGNRPGQKNLERLSHAMSIFNRESMVGTSKDSPITDLGGPASANQHSTRSQHLQAVQDQAAPLDAVRRDAPDASSNEQNRTTPQRSKTASRYTGPEADISRKAIATEQVTGSTGSISSQKEQTNGGIETDKSVLRNFGKNPVKNEKRKPRRGHEPGRVSSQSKLQTPRPMKGNEIRGVLHKLDGTDLTALKANCARILSSPERFPWSTTQICVEVVRSW
jgi:hypothetical protein